MKLPKITYILHKLLCQLLKKDNIKDTYILTINFKQAPKFVEK